VSRIRGVTPNARRSHPADRAESKYIKVLFSVHKSTRKESDLDRFAMSVARVSGKRLTYTAFTGKEQPGEG